jgi:uncharacterized membrane protein YhaH (DUF805 family)
MAHEVGGVWMRELCGALFIIAYVLCSGSGILGVSIGLNALSTHATCTVAYAFVATVVVVACASVRKFHQIGWLTWAGFASIFVAVFIVVVAVTRTDRPAAAPATGEFDLGYYVWPQGVFAAQMVASCTIFISSAGEWESCSVMAWGPNEMGRCVCVCVCVDADLGCDKRHFGVSSCHQ